MLQCRMVDALNEEALEVMPSISSVCQQHLP